MTRRARFAGAIETGDTGMEESNIPKPFDAEIDKGYDDQSWSRCSIMLTSNEGDEHGKCLSPYHLVKGNTFCCVQQGLGPIIKILVEDTVGIDDESKKWSPSFRHEDMGFASRARVARQVISWDETPEVSAPDLEPLISSTTAEGQSDLALTASEIIKPLHHSNVRKLIDIFIQQNNINLGDLCGLDKILSHFEDCTKEHDEKSIFMVNFPIKKKSGPNARQNFTSNTGNRAYIRFLNEKFSNYNQVKIVFPGTSCVETAFDDFDASYAPWDELQMRSRGDVNVISRDFDLHIHDLTFTSSGWTIRDWTRTQLEGTLNRKRQLTSGTEVENPGFLLDMLDPAEYELLHHVTEEFEGEKRSWKFHCKGRTPHNIHFFTASNEKQVRMEFTFNRMYPRSTSILDDFAPPKIPAGQIFDFKPILVTDAQANPAPPNRSWTEIVTADCAQEGDFIAIQVVDTEFKAVTPTSKPGDLVTIRAIMDENIYDRHVDVIQEVFNSHPETVTKLVLKHGYKPKYIAESLIKNKASKFHQGYVLQRSKKERGVIFCRCINLG